MVVICYPLKYIRYKEINLGKGSNVLKKRLTTGWSGNDLKLSRIDHLRCNQSMIKFDLVLFFSSKFVKI
jgi:hypothetical protein